jgi:hypothetical protein
MFVRIEMQLSQFYVCYSSFTILYTYHQYHDKYEEAVAALAQMEMRAVKAERLLEAALQYQSSQQKAFSPLPSPRYLVLHLQMFVLPGSLLLKPGNTSMLIYRSYS